jgi:uncharacterized protein (TIGR04222 family)
MNPFDLRGPEFLAFYTTVFGLTLCIALVLRWLLRTPSGEPSIDETLGLSPYEVVYLEGGMELVLNATLVRLVQLEAIDVDGEHRRFLWLQGEAPLQLAPHERKVFDTARQASGTTLAELLQSIAPYEPTFRTRLERLGFLVEPDRRSLARFLPLTLALVVWLLGPLKIVVGIARHRPVMFLVVLSGLFLIAALGLFARAVAGSRRGQNALRQLRAANAALEAQVKQKSTRLAANDLLLAVGLFGAAVFAIPTFAPLHAVIQPRQTSSDSSSSSGCGGGSCSGGCGGGGCGGCGG